MPQKCPTSGKDCHSHGGAIRAALSYSRKRGTPLRPYFHHQCKSWHLTKKPRLDSDILQGGSA